jgi:hypothetical protein
MNPRDRVGNWWGRGRAAASFSPDISDSGIRSPFCCRGALVLGAARFVSGASLRRPHPQVRGRGRFGARWRTRLETLSGPTGRLTCHSPKLGSWFRENDWVGRVPSCQIAHGWPKISLRQQEDVLKNSLRARIARKDDIRLELRLDGRGLTSRRPRSLAFRGGRCKQAVSAWASIGSFRPAGRCRDIG